MSKTKLFGEPSGKIVREPVHKGPRGARLELTFFIPEAALESVAETDSAEEWAGEQARSFIEKIEEDLLSVAKQYSRDESRLDWVWFDD